MPVITHNIMSQFTNRQLNITSNKKAKSSEKLASGYKVNRSADDAAGLQISEKMRSQIRGLNQASRNIQDGISLCQVADGALNESHAVLQRMRELSVQAANDTNSDEDRDAIQQEIDQLTKEVDRIANDTSFNSEIYPLLPTTSTATSIIFDVDIEQSQIEKYCAGNNIVDGVKHNKGDIVNFSALKVKDSPYWLYIQDEKTGKADFDGNTISPVVGYGTLLSNENAYSLALSDLKLDDDGYVYYTTPTGTPSYLTIIDMGSYKSLYTTTFNKNDPPVDWALISYLKGTKCQNENNLWIQMGSQENQGLFLDLVDATAKGVGITDPTLDVSNYTNASTSISRLDDAINKVSSYRSHFGAQQNRLEYGKSVDDNTAENTQAAESRIRDTDMAQEIVENSKNTILEQVGQSMLAQANQSTQSVLNLLN